MEGGKLCGIYDFKALICDIFLLIGFDCDMIDTQYISNCAGITGGWRKIFLIKYGRPRKSMVN